MRRLTILENWLYKAFRIKHQAQESVEQLSECATQDDLMEESYLRQAIEAGLADSAAGRVEDVETVRWKFGLEP